MTEQQSYQSLNELLENMTTYNVSDKVRVSGVLLGMSIVVAVASVVLVGVALLGMHALLG